MPGHKFVVALWSASSCLVSELVVEKTLPLGSGLGITLDPKNHYCNFPQHLSVHVLSLSQVIDWKLPSSQIVALNLASELQANTFYT